MDEIIQIDGFGPDYQGRCENCDGAPVVTAVKDGRTVYRSMRCGRCTWGEQRADDPTVWNELL